jgi:hypothetical protein
MDSRGYTATLASREAKRTTQSVVAREKPGCAV